MSSILSVETVNGFHRDLNGDLYYLGDVYANHIRVIDDVSGGIIVEEGGGSESDRHYDSAMSNVSSSTARVATTYWMARTRHSRCSHTEDLATIVCSAERTPIRSTGGSGDDVLAGFLGGDIYTFDTAVREVTLAETASSTLLLELQDRTGWKSRARPTGDFNFESSRRDR